VTDEDEVHAFMGGRPGVRHGEENHHQGYIDHAERARKRIAELRAQYGDLDDEDSELYQDRFYAEAPPGWTYEWKTHTVFNKPIPHYTVALFRNGWSPVPSHRHRELLYPEYEGDSIIIDGLMLCERPKELTERRRMRERIKATEQVRSSEAKLSEAPPGTAPRDEHRKTRPRVGSTVGPIGVPD
jgi:hypothetical protein